MTFNDPSPVPCPHCGTMCQLTSRNEQGRWFFCSSCGITQFFYDFKCPVCKKTNTMYGKPLINNCYECDNCLTIVVFTMVKDVGDKFEVKWNWYSGKYKDKVVAKFRQLERK